MEVAHPRLLLHLGFVRKLLDGIDIVLAALQPGLVVLTRQAFCVEGSDSGGGPYGVDGDLYRRPLEQPDLPPPPAVHQKQPTAAPLVLVTLTDCNVLLPETNTSHTLLLVTIVKAFLGLPAVAIPASVFEEGNVPPAGAMVAQSLRTSTAGVAMAMDGVGRYGARGGCVFVCALSCRVCVVACGKYAWSRAKQNLCTIPIPM